jgi:hypothetical protein
VAASRRGVLVAKKKKKKPTLAELRKMPEGAIDAYAKQQTERSFDFAWEALVAFWDDADPPLCDEDGDPDEDGAHWSLCYRLVSAMEHVGFEADTEEGEDHLRTASNDVYEYLEDAGADREMLSRGEDQELEDGSYLSVDLLSARVILGDTAIRAQPIVRKEPKIGRNDPCPCGSGKKYKKCALRERCVEVSAEA